MSTDTDDQATAMLKRLLADARAEVASLTAIRERAIHKIGVGSPEQVEVARFILGAAPSPEPPPTLSERNEGLAPQHDEPPPDAAPSFASDGCCTRHGSFACLTCRDGEQVERIHGVIAVEREVRPGRHNGYQIEFNTTPDRLPPLVEACATNAQRYGFRDPFSTDARWWCKPLPKHENEKPEPARENPGVVTGAGLAWMERALAAVADAFRDHIGRWPK